MTQAAAVVPESSVRPGYNGTGTEIAAYVAVIPSGSVKDSVTLPSADTDIALGVTMGAIADGAYGDVQTSGVAKCLASAAIAKDVEVSFTATGAVKTAQSGDYVLGFARQAADAADDVIEVELSGPMAGRFKA